MFCWDACLVKMIPSKLKLMCNYFHTFTDCSLSYIILKCAVKRTDYHAHKKYIYLIINSGLPMLATKIKLIICLLVIKLMFVGSSISNNLNTCTEDKQKKKKSKSFWRSCTASCWMDSEHFSCCMFEVMILSP